MIKIGEQSSRSRSGNKYKDRFDRSIAGETERRDPSLQRKGNNLRSANHINYTNLRDSSTTSMKNITNYQ